ncbi:MAG TPA: ATP-dependent protease, partial [Methylotenera sp.]|nr:ATP-dependent protease [Methylotenera sp.]
IEGYFRVCQEIGLNGQQGVLIPKRNTRHLILSDEVIDAVANGKFHIAVMNDVADGISHITGQSLALINQNATKKLASFKATLEANSPKIRLNNI